jgi:hypothetical protein
VVYLVPVLTVFLWPSRKKAPATPPPPNVAADVTPATRTPATPEKPQHARA